MITYQDAIKTIQELAQDKKLGTKLVPLMDAVHCVCSDNLVAERDIQPFDNSAMDGFAVRVDDLITASGPDPVMLRKAGVVAAGADVKSIIIEPNTCWHVMTGAPLPKKTEAIVPIENVMVENDSVYFREKPPIGQHIRYAGEDFKKGNALLSAGETITEAHILPLATLGISHVKVFQRPRVLFIPTGTEIIDDLGAPLVEGQIYNSNKYYAMPFLKQCGVDITVAETVRDDPDHFKEILNAAQQEKYDIVVSSGAVSAGAFDFVKPELEKAGAKILYYKIGLKPGKPNLLAQLPSGALYFGLPGNPVATAVGLRFFVAEALRVIRKQKQSSPIYARTMSGFLKKAGLHMILKGRLEYWEDGSVTVDILDGQESFKVSPFLSMNCWIHVPDELQSVKSGEILEVFPLIP